LLVPDGTIVQDAQLCGFDAHLLEALARTWLPLLDVTEEDDRSWDWRGKRDDPCFAQELEHLAVVRGGDVEGVLMTSIAARPPGPSQFKSLLYIEYLVVAPWNRAHLTPGQRFKGVGPMLMRHAVHRSIALGHGGRIGLHSEPRAVEFYERKAKLANRGSDLAEGMRDYFEGDPDWADMFLAKGLK
jgi:GNAT superfamily N-acetyltransferase